MKSKLVKIIAGIVIISIVGIQVVRNAHTEEWSKVRSENDECGGVKEECVTPDFQKNDNLNVTISFWRKSRII